MCFFVRKRACSRCVPVCFKHVLERVRANLVLTIHTPLLSSPHPPQRGAAVSGRAAPGWTWAACPDGAGTFAGTWC